MVPDISPGLPGIETVTSAASIADQSSTWTMLISSPTNLWANDGTPADDCTWSMLDVHPGAGAARW